MTGVVVPQEAGAAAEAALETSATAQTGAASFSELVRAHFAWDQQQRGLGGDGVDAGREYREALAEFEAKQGELTAAYWSTRNASAVAMTVSAARGAWNPFAETETEVRLHRVTDWVTKDAPAIADLLHECDVLAIRVGEVLRGTSERIAMRWILAVQAHLLGFIERSGGAEASEALVAGQRRELATIEDYYHRAAAKAGRIVYVSGMLIGAAVLVALTVAAAVVLDAYTSQWDRHSQALLLCTAAGAVGALVSVLSRMSGGTDKFTVDFEVGRPLLRRLGLYKPLVGSVFGVALYFLLASGLLMTEPPKGSAMYFYGIVAFFAGFSERFTGVIFGSAQRLIVGADGAPVDTVDGTSEPPSAAPRA